ncbi:MAG: hypothetical protein JEZ12_20180 [Desulfobacterium sp.]|nr:hypothetical protein [Desulfobacterium sp.]
MIPIKENFTAVAIALIPVAMVVNIAAGQAADFLGLPVYLDSIGTILVALLCGPWAGALTGIVSTIVWGMFSPYAAQFFPVAAWLGFAFGILARHNGLSTWYRAGAAGLMVGLTIPFFTAPIAAHVYGNLNATGFALIREILGISLAGMASVAFLENLMVEAADKAIAAMIAFVVVQRMSTRYLARFIQAGKPVT